MMMSLSSTIYHKLKESMPTLSDTEREALESGDTWIERDLFCGDFNAVGYSALTLSELTREERDFLANQVVTLCSMLNEDQICSENDLPAAVWAYLKREGFFALIVPKQFGGLEFSAYANSTIVAKIASVSVSTAVTVMVPNSLGPSELLVKYGTENQKNLWLPKLASGDAVPCFALTSPMAGSDAGAISDTGIVCKKDVDGKEVLGIRLDFSKRYITLAPVADLLGLAFKLYDPDHLLGQKEALGITCALIPMTHEGVDNSQRHDPMGLAFMNGPVFGVDCFIPVDWIIGGVENAGKGWKMLVECLSAGRGISLPALSAATAHTMYRTTSAYSYIRKQFGVRIGSFEGIEEGLGEIAGYTYIIEAVRRLTTTALDCGQHPAVVTAITKYHTTELAREIVKLSMDIHAGKAIMQGGANYHMQAYLGMPIAITVEGANILTRNLMIFGQGSIRCHPYLLKEMALLNDSDDHKAEEKFTALLKRHVKYTLGHSAKCVLNGFTGSLLEPFFAKGFKAESRRVMRLSRALAVVSDLALLVLGGKLKHHEFISARLGDVLSYLYMSVAVMKYAEKQDTPEDILHAQWALRFLAYRAGVAFDEVFKNFPNRKVAQIMRLIAFPLGVPMHKPTLNESRQLVNIMHDGDNAFRTRLSDLCVMDSKDSAVAVVEEAFIRSHATADLEKSVLQQQRAGILPASTYLADVVNEAVQNSLLSEEEAAALVAAEESRMKAIQVDHHQK
jgi:alkylation response protein AidB-like acyl-CoA dehydrogenase